MRMSPRWSNPRAPKAEMRFLSIEQARAELAAAYDQPNYALYTTILSLGFRLGQALGFTWDELDFVMGQITVRRALQRVKGKLTMVEPKTRDSLRVIELPA